MYIDNGGGEGTEGTATVSSVIFDRQLTPDNRTMKHAGGMVLKRARNGLLYMGFRKFKCGSEGYRRTEEGFTCERCSATFSGEAYMKLHVQEHGSMPRLMCAFCDATFTHLHRLRSHAKRCTDASVSRALELSAELGGKQHAAFEEALASAPDLDLEAPYFAFLERRNGNYSSVASSSASAGPSDPTGPAKPQHRRPGGRVGAGGAGTRRQRLGGGVASVRSTAVARWSGANNSRCEGSDGDEESVTYAEALEHETREAVDTLLAIMRAQDTSRGLLAAAVA